MDDQFTKTDAELATQYGAYASFRTAAAPAWVEYYGGNPAEDQAYLLRHHARANSHVLDIGCGAGQTLCQLGPRVREAWGFDQNSELLAAARRRAAQLGLGNVTLVGGNVAEPVDVDQLPDDRFDLALSQRGPNLNASLVRKLRADAFFIQELVSEFDGYPLKEILGRRSSATYSFVGHQELLRQYADLGLFPVGTREYFYEEFFRDGDHLATYLGEMGLVLWPEPYAAARDRRALDTYAREHATPRGVRVLRHRRLLVLRRTWAAYYPPLALPE